MRSKKCYYPGQAQSLQQLAAMFDDFLKSSWDRLVNGGVDGDNLSEKTWHEDQDVLFFPPDGEKPKRVYFPLLSKKGAATVHRKGPKGLETGLEFWVDPSDGTYGRVCFVDKKTPTVQRASVILDDPAAVASPGATWKTLTGAWTADTGGAFDLILKRNGTEGLRLDGTGLLASKGLRFADGLGSSLVHVTGPTDQALKLTGANGEVIVDAASAGGTLDLRVNSSVWMRFRDTGGSNIAAFKNFVGAATNTYDLGTSSLAWKELYARTIDTDGAQTLVIQRNNVDQLTLDGTTIDAAKQVRSTLNDGSYNFVGPVGGDATFAGGTRSDTGTGRAAVLKGGPAVTTGAGGQAKVYGADGVGTNQNGGDVVLAGGAATGSGTPGNIDASSNPGQLKMYAGTTGAGTALLGANSPAGTLSAPNTWLKVLKSDGTQLYVPAWA